MMKNFIVPIDIYDQDVMFHIGDIDTLCDTLAESDVDTGELRTTLSDNPRAATLEIDGHGIVVYIPQSEPQTIVAELVHELWHAVNAVTKRVGIAHSPESEECYAYMQAYLFNSALNKLGFTVSSGDAQSRSC